METTVLTDDGVRLWYRRTGEGPPLVLCHGGPGLWDMFEPLAEQLVATAQVVRWDQRGCGRSGGAGPYTLERSIAELDTAVDRVIAPFAQARDRLDTIRGVGKRAAETIIAEIGTDMSVFPTAGHLASWAGRCPATT
jgi:pimeloyl-ACP methyl ester carboxylesterase